MAGMREIRQGRFEELDGATVFGLARLRQDVFVVEQTCAYPDLDDNDFAPETVHFWIGEGLHRWPACGCCATDPAGGSAGSAASRPNAGRASAARC
ncbi:hypothetical protein GCM10029992_39280 [Glycomyces albus]